MSSSTDILVFLNTLLYLVVFIYYFKKRRLDFFTYLLLVWTTSIFTSLVFYHINSFRDYSGILVFPFLVFNVLLFIAFSPIAKFRISQVEKFYLNNSWFLVVIAYLLGGISLIPFFENFRFVLSTFIDGVSTNYAVEAYNLTNAGDIEGVVNARMTFLGKKFNVINMLMRDFIPILFFYFLSSFSKKKHTILKVLLLLASLNPLLVSYISGGRVGIVTQLMYILFLFLLFRRFLFENVRRIIVKMGGVLVGAFILILGVITISRFETLAGGVSLFEFLFWYSGEGILNFNSEMWYIKQTMNGDNTLSLFKDLLGFDTFLSVSDRRAYWSANKTGVTPYIFHTFIGDFWGDFRYWSILLLGITVLLIKRLTKVKKELPLYRILIFCIWYKICLLGFTFYIYKTADSSRSLVVMLLMYFVLLVVHNFPVKDTPKMISQH